MTITYVAVAAALLLALLCAWLWSQLQRLRARYATITDAEREAGRIRVEADRAAVAVRQEADTYAQRITSEARTNAEQIAGDAERRAQAARQAFEEATRAAGEQQALMSQERERLTAEYATAKATYDRLRTEISQLEEQLEDISYGVYKPHFTYDTSEAYKTALEQLRTQERDMIRAGRAAVCANQWEVGGSKAEGARMTKQYLKLMLRAFNGECEAALAKVSWNNLGTMEQRIGKAYEAINQLGSTMAMRITPPFLQLKAQELRLTQEYEEKKQQEKEEQRRIREEMREEERVQREAAQAQAEAEKEEQRTEKALERARREVEKAHGDERATLEAKIAQLNAELAEAQAKRERAKAQAELTKSGHVYILSNMGSFGDDMYKIGMTRRLEPEERVQELSDASVPFPFDIHALVYTENAPQLEYDLHTHFWERRVNRVNDRKEFFRVTLTEIEAHLQQRGLAVQLTKLAEAKEYRQTQAVLEEERRATAAAAERLAAPPTFAANLFDSTPTSPTGA